jgi:DNA-binding MarR family transcriptional regulator
MVSPESTQQIRGRGDEPPRYDRPQGLDDYLVYHMTRITRLAAAGIALQLRRSVGVSRRDWRLLDLLADNPGMRLTELAAAAGLDKVVASRTLNTLVARGLVSRVRQAHDKRAIALSLTARGQAVHRGAGQVTQQYNTDLAAILPAEDIQALQRILPRLEAHAMALLAEAREFEGDAALDSAEDLETFWYRRG